MNEMCNDVLIAASPLDAAIIRVYQMSCWQLEISFRLKFLENQH
jgi:hypothetical protein